jgi:hypothetical protein
MKFLSLFIGVIASCGIAVTAFGQSSARFQVPITVANGTNTQVLSVGVSGDGDGGAIQDNTIGVDYDLSFGAYQELVAPPVPPQPYEFDARILTIPGRTPTFPTGLGGGAYKDIRGFTSAAQVDSFRINFTGDATDAAVTTISWPTGLNTFGSSWTIRPLSGSEWTPVDMLTATSVVIPAGVLQKNALVIKDGALTDVPLSGGETPKSFALDQNYPNPFNPSTTIRFSVPGSGHVSLNVYNLIGQQVATLADGIYAPGTYTVQLRGDHLSSGMYFYRLQAGSQTSIRKLTLLK